MKELFFEAPAVFVDGTCCGFACSHCENDGCGTGYRVTAGIYTVARGLSGFLFDYDTAPTLGFQSCGRIFDERIRGGAQCHDHAICVHDIFAARDLHRTAASLFIGLTL